MQNIEKEPLQDRQEQIWPLPHSIDGWKGGPRPISVKLSLEMDVNGDHISKTILEQGFQRTKTRIMESASGKDEMSSVLSVRLQTTQRMDKNSSTDDDWYILELKRQNSTLFIFAGSTNGFLLGMETFSQVCHSGFCQASAFRIRDSPEYSHRGLSVDVGRRFVPVRTILAILEGMASLKMNAFHFHLNDWVAIRWKSKVFPKLNEKSDIIQKQI